MSKSDLSYLRTNQVARVLGVSVSTIKRWVDAETLVASRTVGNHRLITVEEVERFAYRQGLKPDWNAVCIDTDLTHPAVASVPLNLHVGAELGQDQVDMLVFHLRNGEARQVRDLIVRSFETCGPVELADGLIRPAMVQIGHDWAVNGLDVFQEHRATRSVELALFELVTRFEERASRVSSPDAPLALGATTEGDPYTIPGLLCELTLRWLGWNVVNLGVNLPLDSITRAVAMHSPRLVWLSISHLGNPERFLEQYRDFFRTASEEGAAVLLGGQGLDPELRGKLVASGFGDRMAHLCEFARLLTRSTPRTVARDHGDLNTASQA